jgi:hypothetical protein
LIYEIMRPLIFSGKVVLVIDGGNRR